MAGLLWTKHFARARVFLGNAKLARALFFFERLIKGLGNTLESTHRSINTKKRSYGMHRGGTAATSSLLHGISSASGRRQCCDAVLGLGHDFECGQDAS